MGIKRISFQKRVAKEISLLTGLKLDTLRFHPTGSDKVVRIIFDVIAEALRQNKEVNIEGLGVFSLWERPQTRHACGRNYLINEMGGGVPLGWSVETFPPKTYVHFKPDPSIIEALNATRDTGE